MQSRVMGILNVTPDSFYDGGRFSLRARERALEMVAQGAAIIDIGGESTRSGAQAVSLDEELSRVIPVVEALAKSVECLISVDTTKSEVARQAMAAGADWINDISGGRFDSAMPHVVSQTGATVVLMHSRATPQTMQEAPFYENVLREVIEELELTTEAFLSASVSPSKIIWDPGIGFAKSVEHNRTLLQSLKEFPKKYPLLLGTSRKSIIGALTGRSVEGRLGGSLGSVTSAFMQGVRLFRVHDVAETVDCLRVLEATLPEHFL